MATYSEKIRLLFEVDDKGSLGRLRADIAAADGVTGKFKAGAAGLGDTLKANMGAAAMAGGAALVAFGAKAVGAFTDTAKSAIDMGAATGLAVEDASRWIAVGDDMGVSAEQLTSAFGKIGKSLDTGKWDEYGIATRDAAGEARSTNDILLDTFDMLAKVGNETERTRIGNELFGKGYANLAPLIGKSRKEMESYLGSVEKGQVITAKEAKKAEEWRLAMDTLQDSLREVALQFGQVVAEQAPLLKGIAQMITLATQVTSVFGDAGNSVQVFLWDNEEAFKAAGVSSREFGDMIIKAGRDAFSMEEAQKALNEAVQANVDITDKAANKADYYSLELTDAKTAAELTATAFGGVSKDAADSADEMSRAADEARDLRDAYKQLKGELDQDQAWLNLEDKMRQFRWDMASGKLSIDEKRAALVDVKSELLNYLSSLEGVPAEKQTEVLALIDQGKLDEAEALLENLSRVRFVAINPVTGGQMVNVTTGINGRRALGGDVAPGGTYLVGENGPEYLKMGATGGTVVPNHALAGTTNYFITNQIKADPNGTVQSLKQYERINGTRWRR